MSRQVQDDHDFDRDAALSVICNESQWRINNVSALHRLQYSPLKLKQYASKVKHNLTNEISNKNGSLKYIVAFDRMQNLKYSTNDPDALAITVGVNQADRSSKPKIVYTSIFLCWGVKCTVPDTIHLPYLLEKGEQKVGNSVKATLSTIFDCNIYQQTFTEYHMWHIVLNFVQKFTNGKKMGFTYIIPQADHKQKFTINFDIDDIHQIKARLREGGTNPPELALMMHQMIQNQIYHMLALDVATLEMIDITFPGAQIKTNGTVKMKSPKIVKIILETLNEIAASNIEI